MGDIQDLIKAQLDSTHVVFEVSSRMLKNSEMNATKPIRDFLSSEGIFDFETLENAQKKYVESTVIFNKNIKIAKIRLGFPPIKREARFWIYGLNDFINAGDSVLMGKINGYLVIIPLNQLSENYDNLNELTRTVKLNYSSKKKLKRQKKNRSYKAFKKDYLKQAMDNSKLGLEGELFIVFSEKQNLIEAEREDLANKVEHVSVEQGDGLGYDVLSFDLNGNSKFIEVKTTRSICNTRLFLSMNEMNFSCDYPENYHLYRVYEFNDSTKSGKIKIVKGCLNDNIKIEPVSFSAVLEE